jgi:hypothetical protein
MQGVEPEKVLWYFQNSIWVCRASYTELCTKTRRVFGFLRIMAMNLKYMQ